MNTITNEQAILRVIQGLRDCPEDTLPTINFLLTCIVASKHCANEEIRTFNGDVQRGEITAQQNYELRHLAYNDFIGPMNIFESAVLTDQGQIMELNSQQSQPLTSHQKRLIALDLAKFISENPEKLFFREISSVVDLIDMPVEDKIKQLKRVLAMFEADLRDKS